MSRLMPGPTKNIVMLKTPKIILKAKKKEFVCFGLEPAAYISIVFTKQIEVFNS